jgi:hypothetical protein
MSSIDKVTMSEIQDKVDEVFSGMREARTPEEVVAGLVEISDFIDSQNLTPEQLMELRGIGSTVMEKQDRQKLADQVGVVISFVMSGLIAGCALTAIYLLSASLDVINGMEMAFMALFVLVPFALLLYGSKHWFPTY